MTGTLSTTRLSLLLLLILAVTALSSSLALLLVGGVFKLVAPVSVGLTMAAAGLSGYGARNVLARFMLVDTGLGIVALAAFFYPPLVAPLHPCPPPCAIVALHKPVQ